MFRFDERLTDVRSDSLVGSDTVSVRVLRVAKETGQAALRIDTGSSSAGRRTHDTSAERDIRY